MSSFAEPQSLTSEERGAVEENTIVLLLGVDNRPVRSPLHLEKEVFMLTQAIAGLSNVFKFEPHETGPSSPFIREYIFHSELLRIHRDDAISLSFAGRKAYAEKIHDLREKLDSDSFDDVLFVFKLARDFLDGLTQDELLLLMYDSYRDYVIKSPEYDLICKDRERISAILLKKGLITEGRYEELKGNRLA